jgi:hypothetical protein
MAELIPSAFTFLLWMAAFIAFLKVVDVAAQRFWKWWRS